MPYGGVPQYGAQPAMHYAGWWQRVGATVIDSIIGLVFALPGIITLFAGPTEIDTCTVNGEFGLCEVPTGGTIGVAMLLYAIAAIVYLVIYCRRVGQKGQSWGMGAAGYKIVDERTGDHIGTGRAVGRFFARYLSALPCYLGFLWPLWDSENRTFHDMIVRTRAVRA
jgi:uncharacterized RDD family membrane protein YckC